MTLKLREAKPSDMESVLGLIKELATFEKEPDAVKVSVDELINHGYGKDPAFKVFVAEAGEIIAGMALFYPRYSTWKGLSLHLEDLIVKEDFRGKGVGTALYTKVLKYAFDHNFKRVAWEVLDWNEVAINFYISTGAKVFSNWRVAQIDEEAIEKFIENVNS